MESVGSAFLAGRGNPLRRNNTTGPVRKQLAHRPYSAPLKNDRGLWILKSRRSSTRDSLKRLSRQNREFPEYYDDAESPVRGPREISRKVDPDFAENDENKSLFTGFREIRRILRDLKKHAERRIRTAKRSDKAADSERNVGNVDEGLSNDIEDYDYVAPTLSSSRRESDDASEKKKVQERQSDVELSEVVGTAPPQFIVSAAPQIIAPPTPVTIASPTSNNKIDIEKLIEEVRNKYPAVDLSPVIKGMEETAVLLTPWDKFHHFWISHPMGVGMFYGASLMLLFVLLCLIMFLFCRYERTMDHYPSEHGSCYPFLAASDKRKFHKRTISTGSQSAVTTEPPPRPTLRDVICQTQLMDSGRPRGEEREEDLLELMSTPQPKINTLLAKNQFENASYYKKGGIMRHDEQEHREMLMKDAMEESPYSRECPEPEQVSFPNAGELIKTPSMITNYHDIIKAAENTKRVPMGKRSGRINRLFNLSRN